MYFRISNELERWTSCMQGCSHADAREEEKKTVLQASGAYPSTSYPYTKHYNNYILTHIIVTHNVVSNHIFIYFHCCFFPFFVVVVVVGFFFLFSFNDFYSVCNLHGDGERGTKNTIPEL